MSVRQRYLMAWEQLTLLLAVALNTCIEIEATIRFGIGDLLILTGLLFEEA